MYKDPMPTFVSCCVEVRLPRDVGEFSFLTVLRVGW